MKAGSLNLLEPSGSVKACNGIALPLVRSEAYAGEIIAMFIVLSIEALFHRSGYTNCETNRYRSAHNSVLCSKGKGHPRTGHEGPEGE
jgi:hypothetical protein